MVGCGIGSYKLAEFLSSISSGVKIFFTILGVPVLIGVIILVLYIIWKIWKGIGWLMDQPDFNIYVGRTVYTNPLVNLLRVFANNKVIIEIETLKRNEKEETRGEDSSESDSTISPVSGKDV